VRGVLPPKMPGFVAAVEPHTAFITRHYTGKTAPDAESALLLPEPGQLPSIAWRHHRKRLWFQQEAVMRQLCKGNVAILKARSWPDAALLRISHYTASEIAEAAALYIRRSAARFYRRKEVAAINMVYGAAASGARVMTASSAPGSA